jgi:hypothetical protein
LNEKMAIIELTLQKEGKKKKGMKKKPEEAALWGRSVPKLKLGST